MREGIINNVAMFSYCLAVSALSFIMIEVVRSIWREVSRRRKSSILNKSFDEAERFKY